MSEVCPVCSHSNREEEHCGGPWHREEERCTCGDKYEIGSGARCPIHEGKK
jgi:hypothetical protein